MTSVALGALALVVAPGIAIASGGYYPLTALPANTATLSEPNDAVVLPNGNTLVADSVGGRVVALAADGSLVSVIDGEDSPGNELQRPSAVDIGGDGLVYVADSVADRVAVFQQNGVFVRAWDGSAGAGGRVDGPSGIDVDGGFVYVSDSYRNRVQVFTTAGTYVRSLGVTDGTPGLLSLPTALTVYNGEVYVADVNNVRVQVYGTSGGWRRTWGVTDGGAGGVTSSRYQVITGIEVLFGGRVFITGTSAARPPISAGTPVIEECTTSGALVGTWGGPPFLAGPKGLAAKPDGNVLIADSLLDNGVTFDTTGRTFAIPWQFDGSGADGLFSAPGGAALAPDGRLLVSDTGNGRIQSFLPTGQLESVFSTAVVGTVSPQGIAITAAGDELFVADSGTDSVRLLTLAGDFQWSIGDGVLTDPYGVWVTPDRAVYVADTGADRIVRFTPGGSVVATYAAPGDLLEPTGVAVDASGTVYVSDTGHNRIVSFATTSSAPVVVAGPGQAAGEVLSPRGLAIDPSGDLVVVDAGNNRVQRLKPTGEPVAVLGTRGAGSGEFSAPAGLAVSTGGDVAVADAGNHRAVVLGYDDVAPTASVPGLPTDWTSVPVTVTVNGIDAESGVQSLFYRIGAGAETTYTGPFVVSAQGTTQLYAWAVDRVGNVGPSSLTTIRIDSLPPSGTVSWAGGASVIGTTTLTLHAALPDAQTMRTRVNGAWSAEQPYVSDKTFTVPGEGIYPVAAEYKDWLGNARTDAATITVDRTAPNVAFTGLPASGSTTGTVSVGVQASDATAGVSARYLSIDGAPEQPYTAPVAVSGEGSHTVRARAVDSVGNASATIVGTFTIDRTPPAGTIAPQGGTYYVQDPVFVLIPDVTGANEMRYEPGWAATEWSTYEPFAELTFPGQGHHPLVAQFRDLAGNQLSFAQTVTVDWTPPSTTATGFPADATQGETIVTLTATDALSPIASIRYSVDGSPSLTYTAPFRVSEEGAHALSYSALDRAGNREATKTVEFMVYASFPVDMQLEGGRAVVPSRVVSVESSTSGAAEMALDTGSGFGPWAPYAPSVDVTLPADGSHTIKARYRSAKGTVIERQAGILIDTAPPLVSRLVAVPERLETFDGAWKYKLAFSWSASDGLSGLAHQYWRFGAERGDSADSTAAVVAPALASSLVVDVTDLAGNRARGRRSLLTGAGLPPSAPSLAPAGPVRVVGRVASPGRSRFVVHAYRLGEDGLWHREASAVGRPSKAHSGGVVTARPALTAGSWRFVLEAATGASSTFSPPSAPVVVQ